MNINQNIFKAYDIRGVYPKDINEENFLAIGKAFAAYLSKIQKKPVGKKPEIVVGRDIRLSSLPLAESFINGLISYGFDVIDIGEVTTPLFSFAAARLNVFGGAMITASHNPPEYNGIKLVGEFARSIGDMETKQIHELIDYALKVVIEQKGTIRKFDASSKYLDFLSGGFNITRKLNIVVDASSGTAALFLPDFLKRLNVNFIPLFFEPDGSFKDHNPNPTLEESQKFVKEKIEETGADFGVIFDADADRIVVVDERAETLLGDVVGGIIAENYLDRGNSFVYDLISTRALRDNLESKGIKTTVSKVGHFYLKKKMRELKADLGSEVSGHYYFGQLNNAESAFLVLRILFETMDRNPAAKLSELAKPYMKYFNSGVITVPISSEQDWLYIFDSLKKAYKDGKQSFEDGILVEYDDPEGGVGWWFNARRSNTEPIVKLVIEAKDEQLLENKKNEILPFLEMGV